MLAGWKRWDYGTSLESEQESAQNIISVGSCDVIGHNAAQRDIKWNEHGLLKIVLELFLVVTCVVNVFKIDNMCFGTKLSITEFRRQLAYSLVHVSRYEYWLMKREKVRFAEDTLNTVCHVSMMPTVRFAIHYELLFKINYPQNAFHYIIQPRNMDLHDSRLDYVMRVFVLNSVRLHIPEACTV